MGLFDGITGALFGGGGSDSSEEAVNLFNGLTAPDIEAMKLRLKEYVEQGQLSPEQAEAILVNQNSYDSMDLDTEGRDAMLGALSKLEEIGSAGGLTATDRSRLQDIETQEQTAARGAREAILQNAQARGVGGSGVELLAQLTNAQDAATRQSARDMDVAALAEQRALDAIMKSGELGGNINQQQFGQQKAIADSKNEIAKFNAANTQQVNLANTAANNNAQAKNLENKQTIANANVDQANKAQQYNKGLIQQNFNNDMDIRKAKANALNKVGEQANINRSSDQNIVNGLLDTAGNFATKIFSDENMKKDFEDFDAGRFLDDLMGYRYSYKDKKNGAEKQVGVMAQDLEKQAPQMVEDTAEGKVVDYSPAKAGGPIFASLAEINDRLKRLEGK